MAITQRLPIHNIKLLPYYCKLLIYGRYTSIDIILPHFYFYNSTSTHITLAFHTPHIYKIVLSHIYYRIHQIMRIYMIRLRVRGLGYRIRKFCNKLYRFYFTKTNFIYMHVPAYIIIKLRKRRMILLSNNYSELRSLLSHILLLKTTGPYNRRGFVYPRQLVFLKKGKKVA